MPLTTDGKPCQSTSINLNQPQSAAISRTHLPGREIARPLGRHTPPSRFALLWKRRVCGGARRFLCSLHSLGHVNEVVRVARFRQRVRVGGTFGAVVSTFGAVLSAVSSRRCLPYPLEPDGERRDERRDETHSQAIRAHHLPLRAHLLERDASSWAPTGSHGRSLRLALSHACLLTKQIWQISMQ